MRAEIALLLVAACTPSPLTPPNPDASDAAAYYDDAGIVVVYDLADRACMNLAAIGCPQASTCAGTIRATQGKVTDLRPQCLADAKSKAEAVACKTVRCP